MVALLGGRREFNKREVETLNHRLEARYVAFNEISRRQFLLGGGLQHLDTMLVRAGEKEYIISFEPHEAGYGIGRDRLIGVTDMRRAIGIGNGRRNVVARLVSHWSARGQSAHPSTARAQPASRWTPADDCVNRSLEQLSPIIANTSHRAHHAGHENRAGSRPSTPRSR